ncbi:hypothetical protein N2W54_000651 [Lotmaria passim]
MDRLAGNFLSNGDVANASALYNSLEKLNPIKYSRMARICRVLSDPQAVPLPYRCDDICEALLDPSVPSEVLLRSSTDDVQKSFQRLAVCVHPDKNPNARAKDAFLRLTHMKDKALQILREKAATCGDSCGAGLTAQQHGMKVAAPSGRVRRPQRPQPSGTSTTGAAPTKRRIVKRATPPLSPLKEMQAAASVSSGLDQLRHNTIKLNCFKRKDIADDFEIFSATQRTIPGSAVCNSETALAECGEEALAATAPVLPRGTEAPLGHLHRQPPRTSMTALTSAPSQLSDISLVHSPVVSLRSSPRPTALPRIGSGDVPREASGKHKRNSVGGEGERDEGLVTRERPPSAAFAGFADSNDAIRHQIDQACLHLQEMRAHNTHIRLKLDLSFEGYQRSKQSQGEGT